MAARRRAARAGRGGRPVERRRAASRWRSKLGSPALLDTVRTAFVHGMDIMLWTCGGIAVGCALLAVIFLRAPRAAAPQDAPGGPADSALGQVRGTIKTVTDMTAQASLRERKKARTRASLREHALRLFREQGYQATTVEQIAAAAEVSPSTFFRYFPTKEDVVLQDDMDTRMIEAFDRQPPDAVPDRRDPRRHARGAGTRSPRRSGSSSGRAASCSHDGPGDPRADDERVRPD